MTIKRFGTAQTVTIYEAVEEILTSGTTWTPPSGVTLIDMVICIGGGKGGQGGTAGGATSPQAIPGGWGGPGGNIATFFRLPVSGNVTYQIGAGSSGSNGAAGATSTNINYPSTSSAGGSTWFASSGFVALGGSGEGSAQPLQAASAGMGIRYSGVSEVKVPVGTGGRAGEPFRSEAPSDRYNGQLYFPTIDGSNNISYPNRNALSYIETGGGAGGSGTSATVSVQYGRGGGGGSNTAGGTGVQGAQATNANLNGSTGSGYGGGGGGGAGVKANSVAAGNGGAGANGAIILRYTKPVTVSLRDGAIV